MVIELIFNYSLYTFSCRQIVDLSWSFLPEVYAQSCCTSNLTEGIDVLWFMIKMWREGTQADFWAACRQVDVLTLRETRDHGTNPHGTPVRDGYAYEESLKQGARGTWTSEQGWACMGPAACCPCCCYSCVLASGAGESWGHGQRGLPAAGRSARQRGAAAEAGGAVTSKSCACRRAVHYTVMQQLNITQCFFSLKLLWAYFWLKKKYTELDVLGLLPLSLKMPRLF